MKPTKELKIGVVRRAWAGKTSLISALFRMADLEDRILIDSINILKSLGLRELRSKFSVIPQEPFFRVFSGSFW